MECNVKKNIFRAFLFTLFVCSTSAETTTSEVSFKPSKYLLQIKTNETHFKDGDTTKMRYDGVVTVNFEMYKPDGYDKDFKIVLNTNSDTQVSNWTLKGGDTNVESEYRNITGCSEKKVNDTLIFNCKKEDLKKYYKLQVNYSNPFGNDMTGFYRSSYTDSSKKTKWLLTTHFEPIFARKAFPCFDQPHLKALFEVHLTVPNNIQSVLSNTPHLGQTFSAGNLVTHKFKPTVTPMSTYLLAFTASDLKKTDPKEFTSKYKNGVEKKKLTTYGREEIINAGDGNFAQTIGVEALEGLTKYLGTGYALEKVDQVGIPDFSAGAMENWGHISFREKSLFYNQSKSTSSTKQANLLTITHELVHQWFGNLVTLQSWDYIWLNEAFATYIEYVIASKFQESAKWNLMEQMVVNEIHSRAFETDGLASSKPLNNKITDESLIFSSFNDIPYSKGAAVLRMWDLSLKENGFQKSLSAYIKEMAEKSADPSHLYKAFSDTVKMKEDFFKTWTDKAGYPVVEVKKINGTYHLNQSRFFWENMTDTTVWNVPITYTTDSAKNFTTVPLCWLNKDPITFNASGKWIIVNNHQAGYYRVNYEKSNWEELAKALKGKNHSGIPEVNRAQIINDVFGLARSLQKNYVDYATALSLTKYLETENSFIAWKTALNAFDFLLTKLNNDDKFKEYVLSLVQPNFKGLNITGSNHVDNLMNTEMARWSCALNLKSCIKEAETLFKNSNYTKYPDTQEIVLCAAVRNVKGAWDDVFKKYKTEEDSAVKIMYISALGCSENKTQIEEFLNKTLVENPEIRKQDLIYVLSSVYNGNMKNIDTAFTFVENNYVKIAKNYGGINPLGRAMVGIAKRLNTEDQLKRLKALVDKIKTSPEGKPAMESIENALKIAQSNVKWVNERKGQINKYLNAGSYLSYSLSLLLLCLLSVIRF